ncbi:hypothetical protein Ga0080559_TMP643 [Salipiger profundus]|uniref:Uncharacterized protein n=1 Tax=Salipiger profundus TaxID=1229727 RepID=A0A1U7CZV9_9RHOB|nr:hypothetical protein Ga0080559_TMP643 [Salipiger profundus]
MIGLRFRGLRRRRLPPRGVRIRGYGRGLPGRGRHGGRRLGGLLGRCDRRRLVCLRLRTHQRQRFQTGADRVAKIQQRHQNGGAEKHPAQSP